MPRTIIRDDGHVTYRTALFVSQDKARGFARCLCANARFVSVLVHTSQTSKAPKWFVTFQPSNAARQDAIFMEQFNARGERARTEGADYIFWADPDHLNNWWRFNPLSGETYEVSLFDCSCPDHTFRCNRAGILCKHRQAWATQKATGMLGKTDKTTRPVISREEIARRIAQDF